MRRHAEHMNCYSGYTPGIQSMHAMGYIVFFFVCVCLLTVAGDISEHMLT